MLKSKLIPRRDFIRRTGAALIGAALAPGVTLGRGATPAPSSARYAAGASAKKIRIGIVGGGFGCGFYWHEHPDCVVQAVSDLRPDRRELLMKTYRCGKVVRVAGEADPRQGYRCRWRSSPARPTTSATALAVLKSGKHVISAVPAGMSIEECRGARRYRQEDGAHLHDGRDEPLSSVRHFGAEILRKRAISARSSTPRPSITIPAWRSYTGRKTAPAPGATASRPCTTPRTARPISSVSPARG